MSTKLFGIHDSQDNFRCIMTNLLPKQSSTLCLELNALMAEPGCPRFNIMPALVDTVDNLEQLVEAVDASHTAHVYPEGYE